MIFKGRPEVNQISIGFLGGRAFHVASTSHGIGQHLVVPLLLDVGATVALRVIIVALSYSLCRPCRLLRQL